jgi:hypothetical protein
VLQSIKVPTGQFKTQDQVDGSANIIGFFGHSFTHLHVVLSAKLLSGQIETQTLEIFSAHVSLGQVGTHLLKTVSAK